MRPLIIILCWMLAAPKFPVQAQNTLLLLGAGRSGGTPAGCSGAGITICDAGNTIQSSGHTCTISSVTLNTGDSIAIFSGTPSLGGNISATWNGVSATQVGSGAGSANVEGHMFTLNNVTGATGSVVLTKTSAGDDGVAFNCAAAIITGLTTHGLDQATGNNNTGTTWDSPASSTTLTANEGLVGFIVGATNTGTAVGTVGNSFTRLNRVGQASGTCCVVDYCSRVVSSTGSYQISITGNANVDFAGYITTFR